MRGHLDRLRLRFRSYLQPVKTLSGGNQQKVVLSKWLATKPRLLILDEPTQGIDVQTKAEVHAVIADLARQGLAIILISSELPELLGMCDRIVVLREGRITAELPRGRGDPGARALRHDRRRPAPKPAAAAARRRPMPSPSSAPAGWLRTLVVRRELGLLLAMLAVIVPVVAVNPRMLSGANLTALAMDAGTAHDRRRRPDAGDPDPQHRPVGGLGDRPRRLRFGRSAAQPSRARRDRRHPRGLGGGARLRPAQRARGHRRPRALDRRHAGHAHPLSRLHQPLCRRQAGQRRPGAASLARPDQRQRRRRARRWC